MKNRRLVILPIFALGLLVALAGPADAQRRGPGRRVIVRPSVVFIGGYWYPRYAYDPFFDYGLYGQYGYPYGPFGLYPPYGYAYDRRDESSSIRLEVTPNDAQVFIDGYAAGQVDDYDGIFQRLRVRPGSHEITLYRDGYRTVRQNLYFSPGADQKIKYSLDKLGAGETADAPPQPREDENDSQDMGRAPDRPGPPAPARPVQPGVRRPLPTAPRGESSRFGTLSIRVQPGDAEVLIDGERWNAPADQDRVAVQLSEGRHHVEVRKNGFSAYTEDVLIRANNTLTLNVSLLRGAAGDR